jgi:hypothetical protein
MPAAAPSPERPRPAVSGEPGLGTTSRGNRVRLMENEMVKRLMWSGLLAGCAALASIAANRMAGMLWRRIFDEEPPE